MSDDANRFTPGSRFAVEGSPGRVLEVAGVRRHHSRLLLSFAGVADRTAAEGLRGLVLTVPASERRDLGPDEYWPEDLEGMQVLGTDGARLGVVVSIVLGDAQDRIVVDVDGRRVEVPFVADIVSEVHPSGGFLVVDPPLGLF